MKHSKEWHTCDRCGAKVKPIKEKSSFRFVHINRKDLRMMYSEKTGYVVGITPISEENVSVELIEEYVTRKKKFELCPKCRKEFERFMKNERLFKM